ncbi:DMT family transporter [Slackia piriformis]
MENASSSVIEARPSTGMPQEEAPRVEAARRPGASRQAIASAQVFLGGACYGAMATTYKLAYAAGFTSSQVVAGQAWLALSFFAIAVLLGMMRGRRIVRLGAAQTLKLMGLGVLTCTTSILYCYAMSVLPAPVALTLLFQFTWIGLVIQMISTRRAPRACEIAAAVIILAGTAFASGLYNAELDSLNPAGIACALGAAVSCALFVTLSGKVQAPCSSAQRGLMVMAGAAALSLVACPDFFASSAPIQEFAPYAAVAGLFGMFCPVILFGLGAPHLSSGLSTIMAAAELPMGLLISMIALGVPLGIVEWTGVAAILAGVVIAQLPNLMPSRRDEKQSEAKRSRTS